jgi:hypothetical protein
MENTYFEFQAKGSHAPVFDLKVADWDPKNIMGPNRKLVLLKDGERIIAKVVDSVLNTFTNETYMQIEDVDGNKATISSKNFHKITDPKQWSKKFKLFKIQNHIVDNV